MSTLAVITIKRFDRAKQRLSERLEPAVRRQLAAAMFADVLAAIPAAVRLDGALVVTGDPEAAGMAGDAGYEAIDDGSVPGHPAAAAHGVERAVELGADRVVLLPGDCPLLDPAELDGLIDRATSPGFTVVPDRHGTGTNSLVIAPPRAVAPAFGEGSCRRHLDLAERAGVPARRDRVDSLALDIDTPADLDLLVERLKAAARPLVRGRNTARLLGVAG